MVNWNMYVWYDSLPDEMRKKWKEDYEAARDAGESGFESLGHQWNTAFVRYFFVSLETKNDRR